MPIAFFICYLGRRPDKPRHIEVVCEITQATVQWISSFNGGDHQNFTVIILNGLLGSRLSYLVYDKGENKIHVTYISNLQPSVTYWFYVSAKNSHGSSTSDVTSCKTEQGYIEIYVYFTSVNFSLFL